MKQHRMYLIVSIGGLALMGIGLLLLRSVSDPQGILRTIPYVCIGIGCGMFGHGISDYFSQRVFKNYPDIRKQKDIDSNDERNIAISNRAKGKAFDMMTFLLSALMLTFAVMDVDMAVILLLVAAFLFIQFSAIYYRCKYEKEM